MQSSQLSQENSIDVTHSSIATDTINQNYKTNFIVEFLDLSNFKVKPCTLPNQHNHKQCPFYHNSKDRKRAGDFYSGDLCEYIENNQNCPYGETCQKSHNRVEQLYQSSAYKTKFCSFYPNNIHQCEYGAFCSFAHSEQDIQVELIHNYEYDDDFYMFYFKTQWCPFNLTQHDKALCVYAHNFQDFRRKPNLFNYEPTPCSHWNPNAYVLNYEEACPNQYNCNLCHGWKENEYHPLNYKTKQCPQLKNCTKGKDCAYFHHNSQRRF